MELGERGGVYLDLFKAWILTKPNYFIQDAWTAFHNDKGYVSKFMKALYIGDVEDWDQVRIHWNIPLTKDEITHFEFEQILELSLM